MNDFDLSRLSGLFSRLDALLSSNEITVVAIDGRCASGKTTAAYILARKYGGSAVHTDHFFLPPEMRTPERISEPGGNLHRERFYGEVISRLRRPEGFSYRVFDCSKMSLCPTPAEVPPSRLIICEGSYSLHPAFGYYYDLALFSDVAPEVQAKRILKRNGEAKLEIFKSRWIPMEERYFRHFSIKEKCDLVI